MNIKKALKDEFITGKTITDWIMLCTGILLQLTTIVVSYILGNHESIGLIISNLTGVIFVLLCAQGKIISYLFHLIHIVTYVIYFSIPNRLWGEFVENIMYILFDFIGIYTWSKLYSCKKSTPKVKAKSLGIKGNILFALVFVVGVVIHYIWLKNISMFGKMDSQPLLDSLTSIPAYIGQILLVLGYKEQWFYWFILDFSSIFLAARAGSVIMTTQFIFWAINCIYGFISWCKSIKE